MIERRLWSHPVARYAGAAGLTLLGLAIAMLFQRFRGMPDGLVFAATIAITARLFGLGPSLFASALSVLAIDFTMLPPIGSIDLSQPEEYAYFGVFIALSLVISGTTHSLRLARATAESARNKAEHLASRNSRLLEVTTALSEATLPEDVARVAVTQGFDVLEAVVGLIAVVDGTRIRVLDRRPRPDEQRPAVPVLPAPVLTDDTPLTRAMRRREVVWLESRDRFRAHFPDATDRLRPGSDANAFLALPLLHGDTLVGGIVVGFAGPDALGAADQTLAKLLAQSIGDALARARTFERERDGRRDAETMSRAREEVLGVVAHDLRNPLGVAAAVLQMLVEPELEDAQRASLLASGTRAVQQMNRLIGDLLDVMRLESGRLALETVELPVASALALAEESGRHLAIAREIAFTIQPPDADLRVRADRGRLMQVFANLLGNAMKFTPPGGRVSLRTRHDGSMVVFEVTDTGPGVPPEHRAHLFDRFWQADRSDRRGVGLGLPISKGIVEAHGGKMWMESAEGQGSRFCFSLPSIPS